MNRYDGIQILDGERTLEKLEKNIHVLCANKNKISETNLTKTSRVSNINSLMTFNDNK